MSTQPPGDGAPQPPHGPHRNAVNAALNSLKTTNLLGRSVADLRYVIRRPSLDKEDA